MARTFAVCNQKGGVGKTTTAINLASGLALRGTKTLVVDIDPQGNATSGLGIDKRSLQATTYDLLISRKRFAETALESGIPNLSLVPANAQLSGSEVELIGLEQREFLLRESLAQASAAFDVVVIDCPPSLGLLTINALVASEALLIPLQCEYYALEGLSDLLNTFQLVKTRLNPTLEIFGVVLTMANFRTNLTEQVIQEVKQFFGPKVFQTIIPRSIRLSEAPSFGKPAILYDAHAKGSLSYLELVEEFCNRLRGETLVTASLNISLTPALSPCCKEVEGRGEGKIN